MTADEEVIVGFGFMVTCCLGPLLIILCLMLWDYIYYWNTGKGTSYLDEERGLGM